MITTVARAFFRRGLLEALSYRTAFGMQVLTAALSLTSFFFLARFIDIQRSVLLERYGVDYLGFGLVGIVLLNLQHTAVSAYPRSIRSAQVVGTLEAMLATPTPPWMVLLCAPIYECISAVVWAIVYLVVGGVIFDVGFESVNLLSLCVALPLCLVAFASLGFLGAAVTMLLRRTDPISYLIGALSALLGGVLYPTAVLPSWLRTLGQILPITHALEMIRLATFVGDPPSRLASSLLGLALFCAVCVPLGLLSFGWTVQHARRDGSLSHY